MTNLAKICRRRERKDEAMGLELRVGKLRKGVDYGLDGEKE